MCMKPTVAAGNEMLATAATDQPNQIFMVNYRKPQFQRKECRHLPPPSPAPDACSSRKITIAIADICLPYLTLKGGPQPAI